MSTTIDEILEKIQSLEKDLERAFEVKRAQFHYHLERRAVRFEEEALVQQRALKQGLLRFWRMSGGLNFITSPVIYALVVPLVLLDLSLTVYQFVCFPIYKIRKLQRGDVLVFDRNHMACPTPLEKLTCAFVSSAHSGVPLRL